MVVVVVSEDSEVEFVGCFGVVALGVLNEERHEQETNQYSNRRSIESSIDTG